jgi:5,10-methylene-tetrahydrofolate dehydrogenase/methenyl tetrahydrofolate cyclohydrolase
MPSRKLIIPAPDNVIDGRAIAAQIQRELAQRGAELKKRGAVAGLAFVRVGEDPASKVYVGRKEKPAPNSASFPKRTSCRRPRTKVICWRLLKS